MASTNGIREQIRAIGAELARRRMVAGSDGNISARCAPDQILITPTGSRLGELLGADLVRVSLDGERLEGQLRPSTELAAHLCLYRRRPEIGGVIHAHPPHATAFAVAGVPMMWESLPELVAAIGPVALTDYAAPGTPEAATVLEKFVADHNAFLLRQHGLITVGRTLEQAWQRFEIVEHAARILLLSSLVGGPNKIPERDLNRLHGLRRALDEEPAAPQGV